MKVMVLDIGGTCVKSAVYQEGDLLDVRESPSEARFGGRYLMEKAEDIISSYRTQYEFERIGISTTGQVDPMEGRILYANQNVPDYTGTCANRWKRHLGCPLRWRMM